MCFKLFKLYIINVYYLNIICACVHLSSFVCACGRVCVLLVFVFSNKFQACFQLGTLRHTVIPATCVKASLYLCCGLAVGVRNVRSWLVPTRGLSLLVPPAGLSLPLVPVAGSAFNKTGLERLTQDGILFDVYQ